MKPNRPSLTAFQVATMRAAHQVLDKPMVFEDPLALQIIGNRNLLKLHSINTRLIRYFRALVVARSKYIEDEICQALKNGVRQYVILGAGFDTFAYRNPHTAEGLQVFEIDFPATQQWKREQLQRVGIAIPDNVHYVPVDFENHILTEEFKKAGFKTDEPAIFSWLGVTMYLNHDTVMNTFKQLLDFSPSGSTVVFDYVVPPYTQKLARRLFFKALSCFLCCIREPWVCLLDPKLLIPELKAIGFTHLTDIAPDELNTRFFKGRADKLKVGKFVHLMKAQW